MRYTLAAMSRDDARAIWSWRYEGPYAVYDMDIEHIGANALEEEMLDLRSPWFAVRDEQGELVGFFAFGTAAELGGYSSPHLFDEDGILSIGLGMRPDMTGKGAGLAFVNAGLNFARERFAPRAFRLYVMSWNHRAIRVYERAGFQWADTVIQHTPSGEREFIEMRRDA
jgi:[ribosomal protein S18]-alanine N-acetyltransferase